MTLFLAQLLADEVHVVEDIDAAVSRPVMASSAFVSVLLTASGCEHSMHIGKALKLLTQEQQHLTYCTDDGKDFIAMSTCKESAQACCLPCAAVFALAQSGSLHALHVS